MNRGMSNDINSFSDGHFDLKKKKSFKNNEKENSNPKNTSTSSSASASASSISPIGVSIHVPTNGHRQCSSYDTSMIDTSESYENEVIIPTCLLIK